MRKLSKVERTCQTVSDGCIDDAPGAPNRGSIRADHGESLFDEGLLGHGYALNDMQTRIPVVMEFSFTPAAFDPCWISAIAPPGHVRQSWRESTKGQKNTKSVF